MLCGTSIFSYAEETSFLQIEYHYEDTPLQAVSYEVYQVAERETDHSLCLLDGFCDCVIMWEELDSSSKWVETTNNIENYIAVRNLSPDYSGETDENGEITLYNLEEGLYFIDIEDIKLDGNILEAQSILVTVQEGVSQFEYSPKIRSISSSNDGDDGDDDDDEEPATYHIRIDKIWKNEPSQVVRPEFITVQLYRNGSVYDEVELSEQNGWSYQWSGIDTGSTWGILESKVPENYRASYEKNGYTFWLTNTYETETQVSTDDPPDGVDPNLDGHPRNWEKMPQTGTNAWLIPILSSAGLLFIVLGVWCKQKRKEDEDKH